MVAETRSAGVSTRDRKRVKTQADASALLGISPQRLQEMRRLAPWWKPELSNDLGWDVVGIAVAQCQYHEDKVDDGSALMRRQDAELKKLEEEAAIKRLDRQRKERVEAEAAGDLVRVAVVRSVWAESLGELSRGFEDIAYKMSQVVPPEFLPYVYVETNNLKDISKLSPLQRILLKEREGYERWLERLPEDVFDVAPDEDSAA